MVGIAFCLGTLAGLHAATWGMYKDGSFEGFSWGKYARSVILSATFAVGAQAVLGWNLADPAVRVVFWGAIYLLERAVTEYWKLFFRQEDQSKYVIPMQFGFNAVPMRDRSRRHLIGLAVGLLVVAVYFAIGALEARWGSCCPRWLMLVTVGGLFGWISAIGGAWKDAPVEGFEALKFLRSPTLAALWACMVSLIAEQTSWTALAMAGEGLTIASIETYKTFFAGSLTCGKFRGKPIVYPEHLSFRKPFARLYAAICVILLCQLGLAVLQRLLGD